MNRGRYKNGYQSNIKVSTFNKLSFSVKRKEERKEEKLPESESRVVKRGNRNKNF
jgi:hypothetical protein